MKDPAKLTLRLERDVIEAAKRYAAAHGTSVSRLVETQLREVIVDEPKHSEDWRQELSPPTRALLDRGPGKPVTEEDYRAHLERKYQ